MNSKTDGPEIKKSRKKIIFTGFIVIIIQSLLMQVNFLDIFGFKQAWLQESFNDLSMLMEDRKFEIRRQGTPLCHFFKGGWVSSFEECNKNRNEKPQIILLGDSHAADLYYSLKKALPQVHLTQMTGGDCDLTNRPKNKVATVRCSKLEKSFVEHISNNTEHVVGVIIAHHWPTQVPLKNFAPLLSKISFFKKHDIVVFVYGVRPYFEKVPKDFLAIEANQKNTFEIEEAKEVLQSIQSEMGLQDDIDARNLVAKTSAYYLSQFESLCHESNFEKLKNCAYPIFQTDDKGHHMTYIDKHHVNRYGAAMIVKGSINNVSSLITAEIKRKKL